MTSRILKFEVGLLIWLAAAAACGGAIVSMAIDLASKIGTPAASPGIGQRDMVSIDGWDRPVPDEGGGGRG